MKELLRRTKGNAGVALETTLLLHGVPRQSAMGLAASLREAVEAAGAEAVVIGVVEGRPVAGLTDQELQLLLDAGGVAKVNAANLGVVMHRRQHGATTVSTTMEIAHAAGVRVFATGGIGGVHRGLAEKLDVSGDLAALARFPVAVVTSGVKSILDVESTRELLETLGVCVVGFGTEDFPAFYLRASGARVDARFDDVDDLASFVRSELARTGRGVVIANPIPAEHEVAEAEWNGWLARAEERAARAGARGRNVTPAVLGALHEVSGGKTLAANIALARNNARLAGMLASAMARQRADEGPHAPPRGVF